MAGFWAAAKEHKVAVQKCNDCGDMRFPSLPICPKCWSENQTWEEVEPIATLYSYVVYHRALDPSFSDDIPYAIGRVKSDAGPIFTVRVDVPLDELKVDMPLKASFKDVSDDVSLLQFTKP
jgi:uncharacterized OB-fold protein